jgi:anaerobic selenocysteine-containing dehydrogenase
MNGTINRREFLKLSAAVTAAASIAPTGGATIAEPAQDVALTVRIPAVLIPGMLAWKRAG